MKFITAIVIFIFFIFPLAAQTASEDLKILMTAHSADKNYNYQMKYSFYGEGQPKPIETVDGAAQQFENLYYYKIGNIEQIVDKNWMVTVNTDEKYVISDKPEKYKDHKMQMGFNEILSELSENGKQIQKEEKQDGLSMLKIFEQGQKKPSWAVMYNNNTSQIFNIIVYFNEEETAELYGDEYKTSRLEININYLPLAEPVLKVDSILSKSGKSVSLQSKYKNYTLYDLSVQK